MTETLLGKEYFDEVYGRCQLGADCKCQYSKHGWLGTVCRYWVPLGVASFEQLKLQALKQYGYSSDADFKNRERR